MFQSVKRSFDVVVAEALDRIPRDQADTAATYKRLNYLGIKLHTTSEGDITAMHAAIGGLMNQLFLDHLSEKTRRGQIANIKAGKSGGGNCYGCRSAGGVLSVDPDQAEVVRRIFADYDRGISPRQIAARLNAEAVAGPRGATGQPRRSTAIDVLATASSTSPFMPASLCSTADAFGSTLRPGDGHPSSIRRLNGFGRLFPVCG